MKKYFTAITLILPLMLTACDSKHTYLGYIEGRLTYLAVPASGKLQNLNVVRGQQVKAGDHLFLLDPQPEASDLQAAKATEEQLAADIADKMKGQRPPEVSAAAGQLAAAQAQVDYAQKDLQRKQDLVKKGALEKNQLDLATQNYKVAQANLKQMQGNLATANLPARSDQIKALQAQLAGAQATLQKEEWLVNQKSGAAPVDAEVFDTYYQVGESVPANQAILSLLAPTDTKIIFFVEESNLARIKPGQKISVNCDGCQNSIQATIHFISPSAEYTPPVIYSRSARSKLVYEVEATFDQNAALKKGVALHPGQPVDVTINL